MKALVAVFVVVIGLLAVSLVWVNHSQVETIARLQEQSGLLQAVVEQERRLCARLRVVNIAYDRTLVNVAQWLGMNPREAVGSLLCSQKVP